MPDWKVGVHITLPNFVVIGAGRSGTTSLQEYLCTHPQVFMCPKEPNYFAFSDGRIPEGPGAHWLRRTSITTAEAYAALFAAAGAARAIGEASPRYLSTPSAAARLRDALGRDVRLVAILRNPVERAVSSYLAYRRDGYEPAATLEEALDDQERRRRLGWPFGAFTDFGYAGRDLGRYLQCFPRDRVRVFLYEDLVRDPASLMRSLFEFLGVDPDHQVDVTRLHGQTGLIANPALAFFWRRTQRLRMAVGRVVPAATRDRFNAWCLRDLIRIDVRPETRARLQRLYRDDIVLLQETIGRDLSAWLA